MKSWLPAFASGALLLLGARSLATDRAVLEPELVRPTPEAGPNAPPNAITRAVGELAAWAKENAARVGAVIVDMDSREAWARINADLALNPASNQKIVTAAAALKLLGPSYRYTTGVYGRIEQGAATELVLRGHGDPTLTTENLWRLARALKTRGLTRVQSLLVDQSRFDDQFVPPAFEQQPSEWASFRAPISAIALERNAVTLYVEAEASGKPARAWFEPEGFVTERGTILTKEKGSGEEVRLALNPAAQSLDAELSGRVAEALPRLQFVRRVDDPRLYAGLVLAKLLRDLGVQVNGPIALGGAAEKRRVAFVESEPLAVLVRELGKSSDNFYAEMLLKTLGLEQKGAPAKSSDGAAVLVEWLKGLGVNDPGLRIRNGSGLFDSNRLSAAALATVLEKAYADPAVSSEFVAHLAIGGVDGTLRSRFRKFRDARSIRAKTGTLEDVIALSGYVLRRGSRAPVVFALMLNGVKGKHAGAREHIERVIERIAENVDAKL